VVFTYTGEKMRDRGNFWSLMFFTLSLALALGYFVLGASSNHFSVVSPALPKRLLLAGLNFSKLIKSIYQREHFQNLLRFPISYFDHKENATGALMARLASDFKLLGELIGLSGAFPLIAVFTLIGSIIIAFIFGWKLTLVIFCSAMPVILVASYVRVRYEIQFVEWNTKVFSESSRFATEAVGAFRTVTSLTMEDHILKKYADLLDQQIKSATRQAIHACLVYALCDTVDLCAMALTFW
jgi:ATP-binding cassette, subfamily B (MDR/TAP), member 1